MKISKYKLRDIIRYYELKQSGNDVLAGILRTSSFGEIDLKQLEKELNDGTLTIEG